MTLEDMTRDQKCINDKLLSFNHLEKIPIFISKGCCFWNTSARSIQIELIATLKVPFFEALCVLFRHLKRLIAASNILIRCPFLGVFSQLKWI